MKSKDKIAPVTPLNAVDIRERSARDVRIDRVGVADYGAWRKKLTCVQV